MGNEVHGNQCLHEDRFKIITELAFAVYGEKNPNSLVRLLIKMNGRTNKLEAWRNRMVGGVSVLTAFLVPMMYLIIRNWDEIIK